MTKSCISAIVIGLLSLSASAISAKTDARAPSPTPVRASLNPAFLEWQTNAEYRAACRRHGYRPSPVAPMKAARPSLRKKLGAAQEPTLPSRFNLCDSNWVTSVKNQQEYGTCWAFAAMASLETTILRNEGVSLDLSENNLLVNNGFDWEFGAGGNGDMAAAYLLRWDGPLLEVEDPYPNVSSHVVRMPSRHVQRVIKLPARSGPKDNGEVDNGVIKSALIRFGLVMVSYCDRKGYDDYEDCYNGETAAYYCDNGKYLHNHAVSIVGWDDDYSASNFKVQPPGNGAFIIKNSWGEGSGKSGYLYISYYDATFGTQDNMYAFASAESVVNYGSVYQYDHLGEVATMGFGSSTGWAANVFTASGAEAIEAVGFYAETSNTSYSVEVYTGVTGSDPQTGTLAATTSGTCEFAGYDTVKLADPVSVVDGQKFSVVVKTKSPGTETPIAIEMKLPDYSSGAVANAGESFVNSDPSKSKWKDISDKDGKNCCIKAYTRREVVKPLVVPPKILESAVHGRNYSAVLEATGGTPPYVWSLVGELPDGLSFNSNGVISGVPMETGEFSFDVSVTDADDTTTTTENGTFSVKVEEDTIPVGDYFDDPIGISEVSGSYHIDEFDRYTLEDGEPTHTTYDAPDGYTYYNLEYASAWFKWTAPGDGEVSFSSRSRGGGFVYPTFIAVYEGDGIDSIERLEYSADYTSSDDYTTICSLAVEEGKTYRIAAVQGGEGASIADLTFDWTLALADYYFDIWVDGVKYAKRSGREVSFTAEASVTNGCTNIVCVGWVGTGDVPAAGTSNEVSFVVSRESSIRWRYATNYWVSATAGPGGRVVRYDASGAMSAADGFWTAAGGKLAFKAVANEGFDFMGWEDAETGKECGDDEVCNLVIDRPRSIRAKFMERPEEVVLNVVPGMMVSWDAGFCGYTASGLPSGLRYDKTSGLITGSATKPGEYEVVFKKSGKSDVSMTIVVCPLPKLAVEVCGEGVVNGVGDYVANKKLTLKATAAKDHVFAGWYVDSGCKRPVEDLSDYRTASLSYVMPTNDVTLYAKFIPVAEDWAMADCVTEAGSVWVVTNETKVAIAPISVVVASGSLPTVKVAGLPSGLKFTAKDIMKKNPKTEVDIPANTIYGTPTKGGVYNATVTVTTAGKASVVRAIKFVVRTASDYVVDTYWDPVQGKVTGVGVYQPGKKVTLKATANKGYVFAGWYDGDGVRGAPALPVGDGGGQGLTALPSVVGSAPRADRTTLLSQAASYAFMMPTNDLAYVAAFVTADEDKTSISADVNGFVFGAGTEVSDGAVVTRFATNVMAGVYLEWPVAASALSETTVKVAGLPSGLKFTAKPVTTKVTSGTGSSRVTTVVTNVPANTIYGAPTAASKTAKDTTTGIMTVKSSEVKVTVTTAGKSKADYVISLTVDPLPAWAVGEFSGLAVSGASLTSGGEVVYSLGDRLGSASMSVTAAGKVSGKVIVNGTNCTFSAASYDITSKTVGETNLVAVVTGKLGKEAVTGEVTVVSDGASASLAGVEMALFRNVWKDKGAAPVPADVQGLYTVKLGAGERGTGYLSLTVDKKGAVKVAGKAPDGTALSGLATLIPSDTAAAPYFTDLFCVPSAYKGGYVAGRLAWDADGRVSSDGLDWTSFNPQSTTNYYDYGFSRCLSASGAWYSKTDSLTNYYATLDFEAENRGVGQSCWENLTVSVDQTGKKFVVDQKTTKPVQDKSTRAWSYDGGNDASLTFSFTQATGIWKGSFLWWFDEPKHASQKVPFEGVLVEGEDLEGFGTYDVPASYVPYDKNGKPQNEKTYKVKESLPVRFSRE